MFEQLGELELLKVIKQTLGSASMQMQQNMAALQAAKTQIDELTQERDTLKARVAELEAKA